MKFGLTSGVATLVDYVILQLLLMQFDMVPFTANIISQSVGIIVNFILQKSFIFEMKRTLSSTFLISILFSLMGLAIGSGIVAYLNEFEFMVSHSLKWLYLPKIVSIGIVFFFNFYTKRFAFERKVPGSSLKKDD